MAAKILPGTSQNLRLLAGELRRGEVVAVPTETVYGLAANAFNARACRRIFRAKRRPATDPLIVHIADRRMLERIAKPNAAALQLARAFWPGPLTLILPRTPAVPAAVTAGLPSVAVRMPAHPLLRRLLRICRLPLAAPSANPFGYVSPTTAAHVLENLGGRIDYILDGGPCRHGWESTIVDIRDPQGPVLLRPGVITATQLSRVLGVPVQIRVRHDRVQAPQLAPGQLDRHYSPRTPLVLHRRITARMARKSGGEAWICFCRPGWTGKTRNVFWFSATGEVRAAGRRLFAVLRKLDGGAWRRLHAELAPARGAGEAINDRLRRAAARQR